MKVFLSWSGAISQKVAICLRDWLPSVIQAVDPYVSSEDIDKGARWSTDIARELEESAFGILCVTRNNLDSAWLNFEAGALSRQVDKSKVSPFLFGVQPRDIPAGHPLLQFQATRYEQEDVLKLLGSINSVEAESALDSARLEKASQVWWTQLDGSLGALLREDEGADVPAKTGTPTDLLLAEVLELVREQQRLLRSPEALLPASYLRSIIGIAMGRNTSLNPRIMRELRSGLEELRHAASLGPSSDPSHSQASLSAALQRLEAPINHILRVPVRDEREVVGHILTPPPTSTD